QKQSSVTLSRAACLVVGRRSDSVVRNRCSPFDTLACACTCGRFPTNLRSRHAAAGHLGSPQAGAARGTRCRSEGSRQIHPLPRSVAPPWGGPLECPRVKVTYDDRALECLLAFGRRPSKGTRVPPGVGCRPPRGTRVPPV